MANERVILVDGSSLIFRAYYALPGNLATSQGLHTNAIFGFANMFRKMFAGKTPTMGAVVFDAPGGSFRNEMYAGYKADRPGMPGDLREQLPWIYKLVDAHNFPQIRLPGYEADDVIGTLTRMALEAGHEVYIVAADKDFAQLIGPDVRMVDTLRDVTYDTELVKKKWGVPPEHITDLLALMGDKIDNVPGVPGVGKKTAATLIDKFGKVENLVDNHLDDLKGAQKTRITENKDQLLLSKKLVIIDQHAPVGVTLADLAVKPPDSAVLNPLFVELQFYSLISDEALDKASESGAAVDYSTVTATADLDALLQRLRGSGEPTCITPVFDHSVHVVGDNPIIGVALSQAAGEATYVPLKALDAAGHAALTGWLGDADAPKVAHDFKRLWVGFKRMGIAVDGVAFDLRLASFLLDPTRLIPHRLDQLVREFLHRTVRPAKSVVGSGKKLKRFSEASQEDVAAYACHLADACASVFPPLLERLEQSGMYSHLMEHELPLSFVLGEMEADGVKVDKPDLDALGVEFRERLEQHQQKVWDLAGGTSFNINSTKQLAKVLFEDLQLPIIKRTKTGYSTNQEVLEKLADTHDAAIAKEILAYRKLAKLINTYTDVLTRSVDPGTGRIHATFQQTVGATGRLISTDPDLQRTPINTPEGKRIRHAFVAKEGCKLISADWSQIELRILAHVTEDPLLIDSFTRGIDVHRRTAGQIFDVETDAVSAEQRKVGKTVNFATIYGQGATALSQMLKVPRAEAKKYIARYFDSYAGVKQWVDRVVADAHRDGFVTTLLGRKRFIPELSSNTMMVRTQGERMAANTPIQGSAADICKLAMLEIPKRFAAAGLKTRMLLQIHDELVFEAPEGETDQACAIIRDVMEHVVDMQVPLKVDVGVGDSWAEAH